MNGFSDPEIARKAGQKSKRGKDKIPHELKMLLAEGSLKRLNSVWRALDKLEDKPQSYLNYVIKIMNLVIPKDLNLGGEVSVSESDARARLINRLAAKIESKDDRTDDK